MRNWPSAWAQAVSTQNTGLKMPLELLIPVTILNCYVISQPVCDLLMVIMTEIVTKQFGIGSELRHLRRRHAEQWLQRPQ